MEFSLEEVGQKILEGVYVDSQKVRKCFESIIGKRLTSENRLQKLTWNEMYQTWKIMVETWLNSTDLGLKDFNIGRQMVFFLRIEVKQYVKNALPWRELEFFMTIFLLRHQKGKLSDEEQVVCDMILNRKFIDKCIENFTTQLEKMRVKPETDDKISWAEYKKRLEGNEYPGIEELLEKYVNLRRYWSLKKSKELINDLNNPSTRSYFLCITKIMELFQNTIESPHFPVLNGDHKRMDNFMVPSEFSSTIQDNRYIFGHMTTVNPEDTVFERTIEIFHRLKLAVNVMIEDEKRIIITNFIERIAKTESLEELKDEVDSFNYGLLDLSTYNQNDIIQHTQSVDEILKNWNDVRKEISKLDGHIETAALDYVEETLHNFKVAFQTLSNGFCDRLNIILIKIANFKSADDKQKAMDNLKTTIGGFKHSYKYVKSVNLHYRVSSILIRTKVELEKNVSSEPSYEKILGKIDEVEKFFKYSELEKFSEYSKTFCKYLLNKVLANDKNIKDKMFKKGLKDYLKNKQNDPNVSKFLQEQLDSLRKLFSDKKDINIKLLEAIFTCGTEIIEFLFDDKNDNHKSLEWIPILTGKVLRNYIIHNPHLLQLLPYNYETLLRVNSEILFKTDRPNFHLEVSQGSYEKWIDYVAKISEKQINCYCINDIIKFETFEKLRDYEDCRVNPEHLKLAICRGNQDIFNAVLSMDNVEYCLEEIITTKEFTPFLLACELGEIDFVKELIKKNCNVSAKTTIGFSCFHLAAQRNRVDLFEYLLDLKATKSELYDLMNSTTNDHLKPHHIAIKYGNSEVLQLIKTQRKEMVRKEIDEKTFWKIENTTCFSNIFVLAIEGGHLLKLQVIEDILKEYVDENTLVTLIKFNYDSECFEKWWTFFHDKCKKQMGDVENNKGWSLLYAAVKYNNKSMIEYLEEKLGYEGWAIKSRSQKTEDVVTPLHLLFELKRKSKVLNLLTDERKKEAIFKNIKFHTANQRTLLHWIIVNQWTFCLEGKTEIGQEEILSVFAEKNDLGEDATTLAEKMKNQAIVNILKKLSSTTTLKKNNNCKRQRYYSYS